MDLRLAGKRALVTGSSAGLGEAIAKLLAAEGVGVVVQGREEGRTSAVAEAIRADGGGADVALGDLSTDAGADAVAAAAMTGGHVDILVNNAGAYHHQTWMEATPARWIETYESNVLSGVRMIHRLLPQMRERRWGRVIQIGGGPAIPPGPTTPDYATSLAGPHHLAVSPARGLCERRGPPRRRRHDSLGPLIGMMDRSSLTRRTIHGRAVPTLSDGIDGPDDPERARCCKHTDESRRSP